MATLEEFKRQNPAYADTPDDVLADGLYAKFYAGKMPREQFDEMVQYTPSPQRRYDDALAKVRESQFPDMSDEQWAEYSRRAFAPTLKVQSEQSTTLGFGDEISAAMGGLGSQLRQMTGGGGPGFGESYADLYELEQARLELARAQNGGVGTAVEIGSGIATMGPARTAMGTLPALAIGPTNPTVAQQGGNAVLNAGKALAPAMAGGAAYGFGATDGDVSQRAIGAGIGAGLGAVGAAAAPVIAKGAETVFRKAGNVPAWLASRATRQQAVEAAPMAAAIKSSSKASYEAAKATGAEFSPQAMNVFRHDVRTMLSDEGLILPSGKLSTAYPKVSAAMDALEEFGANGNVSISQAQTLLKTLRRAQSSSDPDEARIGSMLVDQFEDFMDALPPSAFPRGQGTEAIKHWSKGRQEWARFRKTQTVETIIEKAKYHDGGFAKGLRSGFKSVLKSPKKQRGFTDAELAAMKRYVEGGPLEDFARFLGNGSSLPAALTGHLMAGPVGATVAAGGRMLTGAAARAGLNRGADRAAQELRAAAATPGGLPPIATTPATNALSGMTRVPAGYALGIANNDNRNALVRMGMPRRPALSLSRDAL